ncbi:MAG: class I SAM-dependent methyltransferase [Methanomassiliicoccales archaeon]|nr:MAG: class I SAM-dependent methyltransferase [Methanomassiliicoccales archaeon]
MQDYDKWARYYDLMYEGELDYDAECNLLKELFQKYGVPEGGRVLDLGCGTGSHAIRLAKMGYQVTGTDISKDMLDIAIEKAGTLPVEFLLQDMRNIDLPDQYDAVICMFGGFGHNGTY